MCQTDGRRDRPAAPETLIRSRLRPWFGRRLPVIAACFLQQCAAFNIVLRIRCNTITGMISSRPDPFAASSRQDAAASPFAGPQTAGPSVDVFPGSGCPNLPPAPVAGSLRPARGRTRRFFPAFRVSALKPVTYSTMHLCVAVTVAYVLTRDWRIALGVGVIEPIVQTFAYMAHERVWSVGLKRA